MNIKYILLVIISLTKTIILLAAEKQYTICNIFKPHPETTITMAVNSVVLIGQDYQANPDEFPSSTLMFTLAWSNAAGYFSGFLLRVRKLIKQKALKKNTERQNTLKEYLIKTNNTGEYNEEKDDRYNNKETAIFNLIRSKVSDNSRDIEITSRSSEGNKNESILIETFNPRKSKEFFDKEYEKEEKLLYNQGEKKEEMKSTQSYESKIENSKSSLPNQQSSSTETLKITDTNSFITIITDKTNH